MVRQLISTAMALLLCLTMSSAFAQPRGKGAEKGRGGERSRPGEKGKEGERPKGEHKPGNKAPGGAWSEGKSPAGKEGHNQGAEGRKLPQTTAGEGAAANKLKPQPSTGKEGAAAAANRKNPNATGKEGAAAGAAAANRNQPAATGAQGAAAGAAAANRNQPDLSGAAGYAAVRNSFDHPNVYNEEWYAAHRDAWAASNWAVGAAWTATTLAAASSHAGYANSAPVNYGYGDNVTYQDGNVMVDGQRVGTGEEFSQQAADLAQVGLNAKAADTDDWMPLGVFALVRDENQQPQITVQLAINQAGILGGNYTDLISDHTQAIHGSVDKETQRAAWTIGDNKYVFLEAGLKNLTDGEAPALMHKYSKTEKWLLVRLPQPEQDESAGSDSVSAK